MDKPVDEDLIEATIRRVADAAKAARNAVAEAEAGAPDAPTEAAPKAASPAKAAAASSEPEDVIEATIRRVAAEKAAREGAVEAPAPETAPVPEPVAPIEPAPEPVVAEEAAPDEEEEPALAPRPIRVVDPAPVAAAAPPQTEIAADVVSSIERRLYATEVAINGLAERIDIVLSLLERLVQTAASSVHAPAPPVPQPDADDDWDESPQISRMPVGLTPRPPVFRDPSPMTATAAQLEPEWDDEPQQVVAAQAEVAPPRKVDLLPRAYRITVEDKRRGVDLVPLHRALLGMDCVKDMSLLSYNNGVAIVALETVGEIVPDALGACVSRAMSRDARVEVHNEQTMVVKLAEE